jgi:hypothetical protein
MGWLCVCGVTLPAKVYEALLGERDRFMAASLHAYAPAGAVVVMVVGIAHADGIERALVVDKGWALAPLCVPGQRAPSKMTPRAALPVLRLQPA